MNTSTPASLTNRLLAALPAPARRQFISGCDEIELVFGEVLAEAGTPTRYVYFPTQGCISTIASTGGNVRLEVGLVGNEGMLGTELLLDVGKVQLQALVQGAGISLRMTTADFRRALKRSPPLRRHLNRYVCVLMHQFVRTALCAHYHKLESRLARWLLMTQDRVAGDRFRVTQESMAGMLGVRRVGVTEAAAALRAIGAIHYSRGDIRIVDRAVLLGSACACYTQDHQHYDRILSTGLRVRS